MDAHLLVAILIFLICLSGFFSGSETSMMAVNRYRLRHQVRSGNRRARLISNLLERPDRILGVILIGNTYANIQAAAIATLLAVHYLGSGGEWIATILLTVVVLICAEVLPKTLAANYPERFARIAAIPLWILLKILYPMVWTANTIVSSILGLFGIKMKKSGLEHLSAEELRTVVHEAGDKIPDEHQSMLLRILDLEKVTVDDIMIARSEVVGIDLKDEWSEILKALTHSAYTRLPVFEESLDQVVGMLHVRNALNLMANNTLNKTSLRAVTDEPYFVPEGTPLNAQLLNLRKDKQRSAFVVDEYGDIQGLVTLEDILEEIVGEFTTDVARVSSSDVLSQNDGVFVIDGGANIRELNREMDWSLPTEGPKTISGLIIEYLESIPTAGTCMRIGGYPIEVLQVKDNMVKRASIIPKLRVNDKDEED